MKHHGWIVFAIVGLVLVTGLALMYSGGDLKTAGEAKKFGQQYGSQQLPQPPATTTYAPQLPAPPQPLKFVTKNLMILPSPDVIKYSLGSSEYKAELLSTLSEPGGCGSAKIRFNEGTIAEETTTKLGCGFNSYQLRDGSVIVVTEVEPSRQIIGYVHIR